VVERAGKPEKHAEAVIKRGSRKHHDEGHGGAWKVAFADFCLALLSLFLVLWLMAAREQELILVIMRAPGGSVMDEGAGRRPDPLNGGPRGSLIDRVPVPHFDATPAEKRAEPAANSTGQGPGTPKAHYETPAELRALSQALEKISADLGLTSNLQTVITAYGLRVMLHDTDKQGMFERGSAAPTEPFRRLLNRMGPLFARMENQMLIVGHTDSLPFAARGATAYSNWDLSNGRALAARGQLEAGGMPAASVLQVVGMAERAPIDADDAAAGVNRRIELLILTSAQADSVVAMFGTPERSQPLVDGLSSALPDSRALQALRDQIIRTKGSTPAN
jgi:chemotaxis protein MotB